MFLVSGVVRLMAAAQEPEYRVPNDKRGVVKELAQAAAKALGELTH